MRGLDSLSFGSLIERITFSGVTSCTLRQSKFRDGLAPTEGYTPSVGDHSHIVAGETLLSILRDLLGIRVEDMVPALHDGYRYLTLEHLRILKRL
jgi:hypothetical protein